MGCAILCNTKVNTTQTVFFHNLLAIFRVIRVSRLRMRSNFQLPIKAAFVPALILLIIATACQRSSNLPQKPSKEYSEAVRTFYVGLAALQVGDDNRADATLEKFTKLVPDEPSGWANWGVLALRQRNFDPASERLERARSLASNNDQINYLIGLLESSRGQTDQAIAALKKAAELNGNNLIATYKLAEEIERLNNDDSLAEFQSLIQKLHNTQPNNLAVLVELARIAAKRGDTSTLQSTVAKLSARESGWPEPVKQQMSTVQTAANGSDPSAVAVRLTFLRNVLVQVPEYRNDLAAIKPPPGEEAQPLTSMLRIETPTFEPAAADLEIKFDKQAVSSSVDDKWSWVEPISLDGEGTQVLVLANAREIQIGAERYPFPAGSNASPPGKSSITPLDFNYDFKTDLALAGDGGLRLLKQDSGNKFIDVTAETKLPAAILDGHYQASWAADIDSDGDLDLVLSSENQSPIVLRNNGDGTFVEQHPFAGISGVREFVWADIDGDGDPDAALIDNENSSKTGHHLHFFSNERSGQFQQRSLPSDVTSIRAISTADVDQDGVLDLVALQDNGSITFISDKDESRWDTSTIASYGEVTSYANSDLYLDVLDLDNNGANDLLLTPSGTADSPERPGAVIWLGDKAGKFNQLSNVGISSSETVCGNTDLNSDGRLDLLTVTQSGEALQQINQGTKNYHWQIIRPRAAKAVGDQRINSFGVGGEMEIRSGMLVQKQPVTGPVVHFGLGEQTGADVVRIIWPNGAVRAEFDTKADQSILAEQRLKGSCPFLFAFDGKDMKFVKDSVPWGSAIGLRINTLGTAKVEATEEWYKIRGDQLAPRDGYYDLRITAELWETYYYDHLGLMVVDHPVGTDIFVDERFIIPPAKLAVTTVATPKKIAHAWDDSGKDVTDIVANLDENYLDTFGRGRYQGVTRDHYVEVDLGDQVPAEGPLYLIAQGWMHPTDSSINVAISQGNNVPAKPLSLEVPDGRGGWVTARPNLGFPAGRKKISLIDLTNVFRPGTPHRFRLRTTLEIYWDCLEWSTGLPNTELRTVRLNPDVADLHFRGFSVINQANESSPEIPDYNKLAGSKQIWRDLIGYYTRFGDVKELLATSDDRYVIMNAGDEMSFRFPEQQPPPPGWVRDFIIMGDGWIKDGDYNSTFSKTVLPLPYHGKDSYVETPTTLENEWVYKRYSEDWQKYHTRYVTPQVFRNALRTGKQ